MSDHFGMIPWTMRLLWSHHNLHLDESMSPWHFTCFPVSMALNFDPYVHICHGQVTWIIYVPIWGVPKVGPPHIIPNDTIFILKSRVLGYHHLRKLNKNWGMVFNLLSWRIYYVYIWVNENNSLTWIKAIWGWFPLLTMIPVRENSEVVIIYPYIYI